MSQVEVAAAAGEILGVGAALARDQLAFGNKVDVGAVVGDVDDTGNHSAFRVPRHRRRTQVSEITTVDVVYIEVALFVAGRRLGAVAGGCPVARGARQAVVGTEEDVGAVAGGDLI